VGRSCGRTWRGLVTVSACTRAFADAHCVDWFGGRAGRYLNCLHHREFELALASLHRYFDYSEVRTPCTVCPMLCVVCMLCACVVRCGFTPSDPLQTACAFPPYWTF